MNHAALGVRELSADEVSKVSGGTAPWTEAGPTDDEVEITQMFDPSVGIEERATYANGGTFIVTSDGRMWTDRDGNGYFEALEYQDALGGLWHFERGQWRPGSDPDTNFYTPKNFEGNH